MLRTELDLRPSRGVAKETRRGTQTPRVILLEDGEIAGYAELRRTGGAIELATVVVEPKLRGKGLAHQIVHQAWERWRQDPVLHGAALGGHVDLVKATHDETGPVVVRSPLISFTRDAAMAAAQTGTLPSSAAASKTSARSVSFLIMVWQSCWAPGYPYTEMTWITLLWLLIPVAATA